MVERLRTGRAVVVVGVAVRRTVWRRGVRRRKRGETLLEAMVAVGRGEVAGGCEVDGLGVASCDGVKFGC